MSLPLKSNSRSRKRTSESSESRVRRRKAAARPAKALAFLRQWGLLQLQDSSFPSLVALISGGGTRGSWWSHPKSSEIFHTSGALADHPDVLTGKLVSEKVTFVHRRLWPQLIAVGRARAPWQLAGLTTAARSLLARVDSEELVQASGAPARQLEIRLLVASVEVHTRSGAHVIQLMTWEAFARQRGERLPQMSAADARRELEVLLAKMNAEFGCAGKLPWA